MSRIGNAPILIPAGVETLVEGSKVVVKGPKGELNLELHPEVEVKMQESQLLVTRKKEDKLAKSVHGLYRSLINNMVLGVSKGWTKNLELVGVGYRAAGGADSLTLNVGFSHQVQFKAPDGINFTVADNTKITVSGIDRALVGQVAANVRKIKPPEVYKGKGIRYVGEYIRRKAGKAAKAPGVK